MKWISIYCIVIYSLCDIVRKNGVVRPNAPYFVWWFRTELDTFYGWKNQYGLCDNLYEICFSLWQSQSLPHLPALSLSWVVCKAKNILFMQISVAFNRYFQRWFYRTDEIWNAPRRIWCAHTCVVMWYILYVHTLYQCQIIALFWSFGGARQMKRWIKKKETQSTAESLDSTAWKIPITTTTN